MKRGLKVRWMRWRAIYARPYCAAVPAERLFLAGDTDVSAGTAMFIPRGFDVPHLFDRHRAVADRWRPRFRALLAAEAGGSLRTITRPALNLILLVPASVEHSP